MHRFMKNHRLAMIQSAMKINLNTLDLGLYVNQTIL